MNKKPLQIDLKVRDAKELKQFGKFRSKTRKAFPCGYSRVNDDTYLKKHIPNLIPIVPNSSIATSEGSSSSSWNAWTKGDALSLPPPCSSPQKLNATYFSGPRFIDNSEVHPEYSSDTMRQYSVCDLSIDESVPIAPYHASSSALPLLVKIEPPKQLSRVYSLPDVSSQSIFGSSLGDSLEYSISLESALLAPSEALTLPPPNIRFELYRADTEDAMSSDVETVSAYCDDRFEEKKATLQLIHDIIHKVFKLPRTIMKNTKVKYYHPILTSWLDLLTEEDLKRVCMICQESLAPLKILFWCVPRNSMSRQILLPITETMPSVDSFERKQVQRRSKPRTLLLPRLLPPAAALPFAAPLLRAQDELLSAQKQAALADMLENKLIATRW